MWSFLKSLIIEFPGLLRDILKMIRDWMNGQKIKDAENEANYKKNRIRDLVASRAERVRDDKTE